MELTGRFEIKSCEIHSPPRYCAPGKTKLVLINVPRGTVGEKDPIIFSEIVVMTTENNFSILSKIKEIEAKILVTSIWEERIRGILLSYTEVTPASVSKLQILSRKKSSEPILAVEMGFVSGMNKYMTCLVKRLLNIKT